MVLQLKVNKRYNSRRLQNLFNYSEYKTTHFKLKILSKSSKQPIPQKKNSCYGPSNPKMRCFEFEMT